MKRVGVLFLCLAALLAGGCSGGQPGAAKETRTVTYLDTAYTLPAANERMVVTGALEALEDAKLLGVTFQGAMTIGGSFAPAFADVTAGAKPIGERMQPNLEAVLGVAPTLIISSDKFPAATNAQLAKIATTIPLSHYPKDSEANLRLLGEISGRQAAAEAAIQGYRQAVSEAKAQLPPAVKTKKVLAVRIRAGNINVYPPNVFFNSILYDELGLTVPEELKNVKAQEIVSLERLSEINPDVIFLQYAETESSGQVQVLETLAGQPVWRSLKAVQTNQVHVNVVDPLVQGVAVGGKWQFVKAAVSRLGGQP